jgi:hypothetical protein
MYVSICEAYVPYEAYEAVCMSTYVPYEDVWAYEGHMSCYGPQSPDHTEPGWGHRVRPLDRMKQKKESKTKNN